MTPLQIEIMLCYYASAVDFRNEGPGNWPPAVLGAINDFVENGMLVEVLLSDDMTGRDTFYAITDKGRAYVERLLAVEADEPSPAPHIILRRENGHFEPLGTVLKSMTAEEASSAAHSSSAQYHGQRFVSFKAIEEHHYAPQVIVKKFS